MRELNKIPEWAYNKDQRDVMEALFLRLNLDSATYNYCFSRNMLYEDMLEVLTQLCMEKVLGFYE